MTTVAIHQPEYLPWLGYLDKARRADTFVLLDDAQFNRSSIQHRCRIADSGGSCTWLTIPFVHAFPQRICDVRVSSADWPTAHAARLRACYDGVPAAAHALSVVEALLAECRTDYAERLVDAVVASVRLLFGAFAVPFAKVVRSSRLGVGGTKGDRVLAICRELGATRYLSGRSGASYLDRAAFEAAGIEIEVQSYAVPRYRDNQPSETVSALDAWAHLGDRAREIL